MQTYAKQTRIYLRTTRAHIFIYTIAHKGHAAKKNKDRCKQKSNAANKKDWWAANKKGNHCNQKREPLESKKEKPQRGAAEFLKTECLIVNRRHKRSNASSYLKLGIQISHHETTVSHGKTLT